MASKVSHSPTRTTSRTSTAAGRPIRAPSTSSWALFFAGFELADGRTERRRDARGGRAPTPPARSSERRTAGRSGARRLRPHPLLPRARPPGRPPEPARTDEPGGHPLLEPSEFGFGDADLDRAVDSGSFQGVGAVPLRELIARLRATYCGTIGVEYMHIPDQRAAHWLQERMEPTLNQPELDAPTTACASSTSWSPPRASSSSCRSEYPVGRSASRSRAARRSSRCSTTLIEDGGALGVEEIVHRHAAPRPPERARQHAAQAVRDDLRRVRGHASSPREAHGRRRREVPPRLLARPHDARRPQGAPLAAARTRATSRRSTRSSRASCAPSRTTSATPSARARRAGADPRRRGVHRPGHRRRDALALGARAATAPAARSTSSSTTRSASPRRPTDYRFTPLSERRRQDDPGAGLPRERRRPRGGRAGGAARDRLPPAVQEGRHHRPRLLPPARPQRARRPDASRSR